MNKSFDFSTFSKQSIKGIFIIYSNQLYRTFKISWFLVFLVVKDFSKIQKIGIAYFYVAIALVLLLFLGRACLLFRNFQFKIANEHFILKQGILKKTNTSIPFHRIQNINFKQNIIQQLIGVFEVSIETAGSSKTEISIKALSLEKATALKEFILKNKRAEQNSSLTEQIKPLVKINGTELFKVSLTENHLKNLFLFFALTLGLFNQLQQVFDGLGKTKDLDGFIEDNTSTISVSIFFVLVLLTILTVTALLTSFVRIFLVHFNLTAYLKKDAFEISQGLFTKKSIVLKKQKIQNITISTNPLKRAIGISYVTFKQVVSGVQNDVKKNKLIRIVGCKKEQIQTIKENLFQLETVEKNTKKFSDTYYKRRIFIFTSLSIALIYNILFLIYPYHEIFYSLVLILPIAVFLILKKVKKRFYKMSEEVLLVGKGLLETHITYLEIFKVQNIQMKQTFFQERSKVADLVLQTASGKIKIPCLQFEDAIKIYNHTLYKVQTSQSSWM